MKSNDHPAVVALCVILFVLFYALTNGFAAWSS